MKAGFSSYTWIFPTRMPLAKVEEVQASGKKRKLVIFYRILTQEFLHVVKCEKGIQIFEGDEAADSEIVQKALKAVKIFRDINIFSE